VLLDRRTRGCLSDLGKLAPTAAHDTADYRAALELLGDGADRDIRIVEGIA